MPSPFPGMDPYLEFRWRDVHNRLITYISDALQEQLPPELLAQIEERVVLETDGGVEHGLFPDLQLVETSKRAHSSPLAEGQVAVAQPEILKIEIEPRTDGYIQIIDRDTGNRVVTYLEVLSPTNKLRGADRDAYLKKQKKVCNSDSNLVEIDLLRTGLHTVAFNRELLAMPRWTPYYVCVRRATTPRRAEIYRIPLLEKLPVVNVPLRPTDADVTLDLQGILEQLYKRGRYENELNYDQQPYPPFHGEEAAAIDMFLREKGARTAPATSPRRRKPPRAPR